MGCAVSTEATSTEETEVDPWTLAAEGALLRLPLALSLLSTACARRNSPHYQRAWSSADQACSPAAQGQWLQWQRRDAQEASCTRTPCTHFAVYSSTHPVNTL